MMCSYDGRLLWVHVFLRRTGDDHVGLPGHHHWNSVYGVRYVGGNIATFPNLRCELVEIDCQLFETAHRLKNQRETIYRIFLLSSKLVVVRCSFSREAKCR